MTLTVRRPSLPILAGLCLAVATAVGAVLAIYTSGPAESGVTPFRLCDTVVPRQAGGPKGGIEVSGRAKISGGTVGRPDLRSGLSIIIRRDSGRGKSSSLVLDPKDGRVVRDHVQADDRAEFDAILNGLKVGPLSLESAPWPYSDRDKGEPVPAGLFHYVPAAEGSGLIEVFESIDGDPGGQVVHLVNCRSQLDINFTLGPSGRVEKQVLTDWVDPIDRDAFQRFADQVTLDTGQ